MNINKKGFTLVEILAVMVILAMLLLLAIPAITRQVELARKKAFIEDANTVLVAVRDNVLATESDIPRDSVLPSYEITKINSLLDKKLGKSPFGGTYETASVKIQTDHNKIPTFSICLIDSDGMGFGYTIANNLDINLFDLKDTSKDCNTKSRRTSTIILLRDFIDDVSNEFKHGFTELVHTDFTGRNTQMGISRLLEYRFVGNNDIVQNNYVYFNCSDVTNQSRATCDLYRIIGMGSVDNGHGTYEQRVKLISTTPVKIDGQTKVHWSGTSENNNDWTQSPLKTYLNTTFYNSIDSKYRGIIAPAKFYLGGAEHTDSTYTTKELFEYERKNANTESYKYFHSNHATTTSWTGLVGLMYGSDFGYSAIQNESCKNTPLRSFNTNSCPDNSWIWKLTNGASSTPSWTITQTSTINDVYITSNVGLNNTANVSATALEAYPVVYLSENAEFVGGNGSEDNPYRLFNK